MDYPKSLMWSHYAGGHAGFCAGFNTVRLLRFCDQAIYKGIPILPEKIIYYDKLPVIDPYKMNDEDIHMTMLFSKYKHWEYEQEYRLICANHPNFSFKTDFKVLESVTLGMKCSANDEAQIKGILRVRGDGIPLYRVQKVFDSFEDEFETLDY